MMTTVFRRSWAALLIREGFQVLEAACAEAALATLGQSDRDVDLMLSDIEMQGIGGMELASRARELRPTLKALLMSGSPSGIAQNAPFQVLVKPFSLEQLTQRIQEQAVTRESGDIVSRSGLRARRSRRRSRR